MQDNERQGYILRSCQSVHHLLKAAVRTPTMYEAKRLPVRHKAPRALSDLTQQRHIAVSLRNCTRQTDGKCKEMHQPLQTQRYSMEIKSASETHQAACQHNAADVRLKMVPEAGSTLSWATILDAHVKWAKAAATH